MCTAWTATKEKGALQCDNKKEASASHKNKPYTRDDIDVREF